MDKDKNKNICSIWAGQKVGVVKLDSEVSSADLLALVQRLADWSRKYPRGKIYPSNGPDEIDSQLIEMENEAKRLCPEKRANAESEVSSHEM